jgi:hypothetical protein
MASACDAPQFSKQSITNEFPICREALQFPGDVLHRLDRIAPVNFPRGVDQLLDFNRGCIDFGFE